MTEAAETPESGPPSGGLVELIVEEAGWHRALPDLEHVATRAAGLALGACGVPPDRFVIALLACSDARIAGLNAEFRTRATPTNVLSWPAFVLAPPRPGAPPDLPPREAPGSAAEGRRPLGDIAIALETVAAEAQERGLPLKNHATHLIVHGCLHLLGYDHQTPPDAMLMEGLEGRVLAEAGIPDPYDEEARATPAR